MLGLGANPAKAAAIDRLAVDDRMRWVWGTRNPTGVLLMRSSGGGYKTPAVWFPVWAPPIRPRYQDKKARRQWLLEYKAARLAYEHARDDPEERQMMALRQLFLRAALVGSAFPAVTASQLQQTCKQWTDAAARLREDAAIAKSLGLGTEEERNIVDQWAYECDWRARSYTQLSPLVLKKRNSPDIDGYIALLVAEVEKLFRNRLYKTVARIASVALDREVTSKMVRDVCPKTSGLRV